MRTIAIIFVSLTIFLAILGAVFVVGGMYQQELFEDYMEDAKKTPKEPKFDDIPSLVIP